MKKLFLLLALFFTFNLVAQLTVVSHSPSSQSLNTEVIHTIEITFSEEISPFTFGNENFQVFGRWSGPMIGNYNFNSDFTSIIFEPEGAFIAGEMITVNLSKNVSTPLGVFLDNGYSFQYWIKTETASLELNLVQEIEMKLANEDFIQCYGAYAGDLNDDGFSDLAVVNEFANDVRVLLNDGNGTYTFFTIYDMPLGFKPSPNEGADFNHDGFIDLAVSHVQSDVVSVLMGDGNGGFLPEVGYTVEQGVRGLAVIDLEADGHPDIVTANRDASSISMLSNDGTGLFPDINTIPGGSDSETAVAVADANEDGIMDLFVGAYSGSEVFILINDGEGNFSNGGSADVSGQVWMITIGDVNNDGHVDLVSANSSGNNCSVHFGDGEGDFSDSFTYPTNGNFPLAIDLGDLDGDGDLDMISSNYGGANYTLFENDGTGIFINPTSYPAASAGSCAIFHDRDNNGTMDLTLIDELQDLVFLYDNPLVGIFEIESLQVSVSPNPFKDHVQIVMDEFVSEKLNIFNNQGQLVTLLTPISVDGKTYFEWKTDESIASGIYFYELEHSGRSGKTRGKLIKE